jgi:hypothetical protein
MITAGRQHNLKNFIIFPNLTDYKNTKILTRSQAPAKTPETGVHIK